MLSHIKSLKSVSDTIIQSHSSEKHCFIEKNGWRHIHAALEMRWTMNCSLLYFSYSAVCIQYIQDLFAKTHTKYLISHTVQPKKEKQIPFYHTGSFLFLIPPPLVVGTTSTSLEADIVRSSSSLVLCDLSIVSRRCKETTVESDFLSLETSLAT